MYRHKIKITILWLNARSLLEYYLNIRYGCSVNTHLSKSKMLYQMAVWRSLLLLCLLFIIGA